MRRLEGRRLPQFQRIGRLHVEVAVAEHRGLARGMQPVRIDQRMALGFDDLDVLHPGVAQLGGDKLRGPVDVAACARAAVLMLGMRMNSFNSSSKRSRLGSTNCSVSVGMNFYCRSFTWRSLSGCRLGTHAETFFAAGAQASRRVGSGTQECVRHGLQARYLNCLSMKSR